MAKLAITEVLELIDQRDYSRILDEYKGIPLYNRDMSSDERFIFNVVKILSTMERISKFKNYDYKEHEYDFKDHKCINRFYQELNNQNYDLALKDVDKCINYYDKKEDHVNSLYFSYYEKILYDANEVQQEAIRRAKVTSKNREIYKMASKSQDINYSDLLTIYDYALNAISLKDENNSYGYLKDIINIIDLIFQLDDGQKRDVNYFGTICSTENDPQIQMKVGSYPQAYEKYLEIISDDPHIGWRNYLTVKVLKYLYNLLSKKKEKLKEDNSLLEIDYNWDEEFNKILKSNETDPELIASVVLAKSLNK